MRFNRGIRRGYPVLGLLATLILAVAGMSDGAVAGGKDLTGVTWTWQRTLLNDGQAFAPADPSRYTLAFLPEGRVAVRADCNQGSGGYSIEGNRIDIGPIATTLIACPPGSLGDRFLLQLNDVTSYLFADGDLILELPVDSGGMRFAPSTPGGPTVAPAGAAVSGTVTYRERIALPPDAVVTVQIEDSSRADASAVVIGEQVISAMGRQVPIPFSVGYDLASIDPSARYTLRVRITVDGGRLFFINDTSIPVITRDSPTSGIEIVVVRAG